jgi:hypothetical protein
LVFANHINLVFFIVLYEKIKEFFSYLVC